MSSSSALAKNAFHWIGGMAQEVGHLFSKHNALSSASTTAKKMFSQLKIYFLLKSFRLEENQTV
jgi:hypothetical protein